MSLLKIPRVVIAMERPMFFQALAGAVVAEWSGHSVFEAQHALDGSVFVGMYAAYTSVGIRGLPMWEI